MTGMSADPDSRDMRDIRPHARSDRPATLRVDDLSIEFASARGTARVVDRASLEVWPGEIVGLIGESGSGKTMTALSVLGLRKRSVRPWNRRHRNHHPHRIEAPQGGW